MQAQKLIIRLYGSSFSPDGFWEALDATRLHLGAGVVTLIGWKQGGTINLRRSTHPDARFAEQYADKMFRMHRLHERLEEIGPGKVLRNAQRLIRHELDTAQYQQWMRRWNLRHDLGALLGDEELGYAHLVYHWSVNEPPPGGEAARNFRTLLPHLQGALRVCRCLDRGRARETALWRLIDQSPHGVALLNDELAVLAMNLEAKRIFEEKDPVGLRAGKLIGDARLTDVITQRLAPRPSGESDEAGMVLLVPRGGGRLPLAVSARRVVAGRAGGMGVDAPTIALFLRDVEREHDLSFAAFAAAFQLTRAEARVVHALAAGKNLSQHARDERITTQTARWHLKNVFSKTHCVSQVELVSLFRRFVMPRL